MILTGPEIRNCINKGDIIYTPYDSSAINPNIINYRIGTNFIEFPHAVGEGLTITRKLGEAITLKPKSLYLAHTLERIGSSKFAATLLGRSSIGRLGIFANISADLGHTGSLSQWTLELKVVQPVTIYAGMQFGQIAFWVTSGAIDLYGGRYQCDGEAVTNKDSQLTVLPRVLP